MTSDWRQARIANNEASFREINDRLEQGLQQVRHQPELQHFVCECGDSTCGEMIALTFEEYQAVRRDSRRFAIVPGHVLPETERVVDGNDRYDVVEKFGHAVEVVDAADDRAPGGTGRRSDDTIR